MRNLLNNVLGRAQLLELEDDLPDEASSLLSDLCHSCRVCVEALHSTRPAECEDASPGEEERGLPSSLALPGPASMPAQETMPSRPASILVVDDNADSREQLRRFLEHAGHEVHFCMNGPDAIEFLVSNFMDLVLLDLNMPGMNGFQVLERLRAQGVLNHTPVIIVSGLDFETHAVRGIEMGAHDYISRPVDLSLLRARMNAALERQRLRESELARYFTASLARELIRRPALLQTGKTAEVSVLFVDVVGFSSISERLGPIRTLDWISSVMETFSECIHQHGGVLVDYTGDQIMALWGAPQQDLHHATHACEAALSLMRCLSGIDEQWHHLVGGATTVTIGINTGETVVGNVGTRHKFKYGALGSTVNMASRLQSATKHLRVAVVISGHTHARLSRAFFSRRLTRLKVNNIEEPVDVYEISDHALELMRPLYEGYETALKSFENGDFHQASALLGDLLKHYPDDGPTALLLSRAVNAILDKDKKGRHDSVWVLSAK
ncbi:MAG: adenylate/guanylate cyclase domain-containing response regulator [Verrucomicrobiaceae bacterium]|nr:adenylate/guanylate cyclase domain-containing response regulator [Verrucomicrobiaceae bacterium]